MISEAFEAQFGPKPDAILEAMSSDDWNAMLHGFTAALRWADGQGWLQHSGACCNVTYTGAEIICTCGLDALRKELAE